MAIFTVTTGLPEFRLRALRVKTAELDSCPEEFGRNMRDFTLHVACTHLICLEII